jgi:protein-S-isoprenylcysteine O-methyltransferase Ste14
VSALETRIPPPVLLVVVAGLMLAAGSYLPPSPFSGGSRMALSAILFVLAGVFGAPAVRAFLRAGTTINPVDVDRASKLVTAGAYGISRNPMYVSMVLLLLSLAAGSGQLALLLGPLGFALFITRFQIIPEERAMTEIFGGSYESYKARVRRWV